VASEDIGVVANVAQKKLMAQEQEGRPRSLPVTIQAFESAAVVGIGDGKTTDASYDASS
jgi:hypothetical protein